ncbi:MAG: hypothetical protein OXE81_00400 [Gammaproteobacteria bacterium]|nr:hypothetical protein [Gammaproteobacteria bacterium]
MPKNNLNGSVELLAEAMRDVFSEGVEQAVKPLNEKFESLRVEFGEIRTELGEMEDRLNKRIDTTNENMQVQFREQERKIEGLFKAKQT